MQIHTVTPGDSIYSVAQEYGVPQARIITDNLLSHASTLVPGQDLIIRYPTVTHTVSAGETVDSLAERYQTSPLALYRNNPMLNGQNRLYPGQILNIAYSTPLLGQITTNGYAYPTIEEEVLRRTLPYLTYLSVFSTGIRPDGTLIPPENAARLIEAAGDYDTVPLLVLTSLTENGNFSSELASRVLSEPELRRNVVENVASEVPGAGYGGVDLDFEYIPANLAEEYGNFAEEIREALGGTFPVFVSLAPKYRRDQPGVLYEGHDYEEIGEDADRVLLMTYEWGYAFGPPMPVSPYGEVRRVLDYAVTEMDPEKILLGIPNYGYDWTMPYVRGQSRAPSLSNEEALSLARQNGGEIRFDTGARSPYFTYYSGNPAAEHIVWFENARFYDAMLRLVREYGLGGMGVWNIMEYDPSLWSVLNALYDIRKREILP